MAAKTSDQKDFSPEDFSRFLIREFLKRSKFDKTYDVFMQEDTRPKVTMTKSELTSLLGLQSLVSENSRTKPPPYNTMLDIISNYLARSKAVLGGVEPPEKNTSPSQRTTAASFSSSGRQQAQQKGPQRINSYEPHSSNRKEAPPAATSNTFGQKGIIQKKVSPKAAVANAYAAPVQAPSKTQSNFFQQKNNSVVQKASNTSSNSLLASEHVAQMVSKKKGHNNVVALDDDEEDWDNVQVNQAEKPNPGAMTFYNRGPWGGNEQKKKSETMGGSKASVVTNPVKPKQGGFMAANDQKNPAELDDWDSPSPQKARQEYQPPVRQEYQPPVNRSGANQQRPMTSGAPGMRGLGAKNLAAARARQQKKEQDLGDFDDFMDDDIGLKPKKEDPLLANSNKKKQKAETTGAGGGHDTLGFLKRAEEEKQNREQQRQNELQNANQAYKRMEDLKHNLNGYTGCQADSFAQPPSSSLGPQQQSNLSPQESQGIKQLLFKSQSGNFHNSWCQGFYFDDKVKYGIFQDQGGPCGILATVQAFFLKHLLFLHKQKLTGVTTNQQQDLVASAITDILINSASGNPSGNVQLCLPQNQNNIKMQAPIQPSQVIKNTFNKGPEQRRRLLNTIRQNLPCFIGKQGPGVVLLVYSAILSKGVKELTADMDMDGITLVNEYGYASQELINTMLVGRGASNVHDGDKDLGGDKEKGESMILKGILRRSEIGFLTFFEHYGYFTVGEHLKRPNLPIWIVCSESHYSVLFSTDIGLVQSSTPAQFDLVYWDELSRQEDDIILTVEPGMQDSVVKKGLGGRKQKEVLVPIDAVIRTKWEKARINWNGRTVIL